MKLARILLLAVTVTTSFNAVATVPIKSYLLGDEKTTSAAGTVVETKALFIEKTMDPDNSLMTERAIEVSADHSVADNTVILKIAGNDFTISDTKKSFTGVGKLLGAPWQWTYFKAEYNLYNGMKIQDEDFMADPSAISSRKTVYLADGTVAAYLDMTLKAISKDSFDLVTQALLAK